MIAVLLVATFFTVILTGPAAADWRDRRRQRRDQPLARVIYLPSSTCRPERE